MGKLEGRVAIVTGGSRGIGQAIALTFAKEGAEVIVNYVKQKRQAEKVVEQIQTNGGNASALQADMADRKSVEHMVSMVLDQFGKVDILVNNAGILLHSDVLSFTDEDVEMMWSINVKGVLYCTRAVAPHMIRNKYGKIINLSSIAGLGTAAAATTPYAATKAAVAVLTKRFALELGSYGINVNAIAPGLIKTDLILKGVGPDVAEGIIKYCQEASMLRRVGEPQDVANAALFLASDDSSFMTGQVITVDGGRMDFLSHSL
jgi:3-oxoacyl-[acyl-carrier protein] reductase